MRFNYGYERKKFEEEWKRLREEYAAAGMSGDAIDAMYRYDLDSFREQRKYCRHTQLMNGFDSTAEKSAAKEDAAPLHKRLLEQLCVDMPVADPDRRHSWIDELENEKLVRIIRSLPGRDIEFLTLSFEGYSHDEIAASYGVCRQFVTKKFLSLRKKMKKL